MRLAGLLTARDFRREELPKKDHHRLRAMGAAVQEDRVLLLELPNECVALLHPRHRAAS